ncbi:phycobilisome rod-core linker polypeptide [Calothrix sp. PCC 6303]|uniref:phycobilisome rod-core linker polypeptide n=1 Tax=Calothrix sp. PCC 6303 TaxID=1170562 RepID=UPI0002A03634|nr:phycobilisome rod-core linker polypeptide [Calothrix sp. PCC 6303]AFZ00396.1 Phycobilisome linker polypeptide [Calothrix sp. PCC 6303]
MSSLVLNSPKVELWQNSSTEEIEATIRAVYKHVMGNAHLMESERLISAESQLRDRKISVKDFVRAVAKSDIYRARFFESAAPYRFIELNFKHLLGRAPNDQTEISEHIQCCINNGYEAEIDSYIDSAEYQNAFGDNIVPYYRGNTSQVGQKQVAYNRIFGIVRGAAETSSAVKDSQLVYSVASNSTSKIRATANSGSTEKRFKIVVTGSKFDAPRRISTNEYIVSATKMTPQIQRIHRAGGKIVSITEIV